MTKCKVSLGNIGFSKIEKSIYESAALNIEHLETGIDFTFTVWTNEDGEEAQIFASIIRESYEDMTEEEIIAALDDEEHPFTLNEIISNGDELMAQIQSASDRGQEIVFTIKPNQLNMSAQLLLLDEYLAQLAIKIATKSVTTKDFCNLTKIAGADLFEYASIPYLVANGMSELHFLEDDQYLMFPLLNRTQIDGNFVIIQNELLLSTPKYDLVVEEIYAGYQVAKYNKIKKEKRVLSYHKHRDNAIASAIGNLKTTA